MASPASDLSAARRTCTSNSSESVSDFLGMDDTILYGSCFDANGGLFETFLGPEDAVISDALNHASIIDGVRLCKARRYRFAHADLKELEDKLIECQDARLRMIATDGVFSMDGDIAQLDRICDLADKYRAMVMVDDSHATGFVGKTGRGTHEYRGAWAGWTLLPPRSAKPWGAHRADSPAHADGRRTSPQSLAALSLQ